VWGAPAPGAATGKRRGWLWLWALIAALVVLTGTAVTGIVLLVTTLTGPSNATSAYLRDLRDGRFAAAYGHLCAARRSETPLPTFTDEQRRRTSAEGAIMSFFVYDGNLHGSGRAGVDYDLVRTLSRQTWHVDLVKERGAWRLCHFEQLSG
jgi:hypothetical protein